MFKKAVSYIVSLNRHHQHQGGLQLDTEKEKKKTFSFSFVHMVTNLYIHCKNYESLPIWISVVHGTIQAGSQKWFVFLHTSFSEIGSYGVHKKGYDLGSL